MRKYCLLLIFVVNITFAQNLVKYDYQPNGKVKAIAVNEDYTYVGGDFSKVGIPLSNFAMVTDADPLVYDYSNPAYPKVNGEIYTIIPDGNGGFYIGGDFTEVGGYEIKKLAHINSDLSVDQNFIPPQWIEVNTIYPDAVRDMILDGDNLYVSGLFFYELNGSKKGYIAKLDKTTGALDQNFNQNNIGNHIDNGDIGISEMELVGDYIYTVGLCTILNSPHANSTTLLKFNKTTGEVPSLTGTGYENLELGPISSITVYENYLYVAGELGLGRVNLLTGNVDDSFFYNIAQNPPLNWSYLFSIRVYDGYLYIFGAYDKIGGISKTHLSRMNLSTGNIDEQWEADYIYKTDIPKLPQYEGVFFFNKLFIEDGYLYLNATVNNSTAIYRLNVQTGAADNSWVFNSEKVLSLCKIGNNIFVGGGFEQVNSFSALGLYRYNNTTLNLDRTWTAQGVQGNVINTIKLHNDDIYIGGKFSSIGGVNINNLAKLSQSSGFANASWKPEPNDAVNDIILDHPYIYVGGAFTNIGGSPLVAFGRLYLDNASADASLNLGIHPSKFYGNSNDKSYVYTLAMSERGFITIGGSFDRVDKLPQYNGLITISSPFLKINCDNGSIEIGHHKAVDPNNQTSVEEMRLYYPEDYLIKTIKTYRLSNFDKIKEEYYYTSEYLYGGNLSGFDYTNFDNGNLFPYYKCNYKISNGVVNVINNIGKVFIVGGAFPNGLVAFNSETGAEVPGFNFSFNEQVNTIAKGHNKIIVGGDFNKVDNNDCFNLAMIDNVNTELYYLDNFWVRKQEGLVDVLWNTSDEPNLKSFDIERRVNGGSWSRVVTVNANSLPNYYNNYSYEDINPPSGVLEYRLLPKGTSIIYSYSDIAKLNYVSKSNFILINKIQASDGSSENAFGVTVDIEGDYAVVGSPLKDAAYIFKNVSDQWVEVCKLTPSSSPAGSNFGYTAAIKNDFIFISSLSDNSIYIYKNIEGNWLEHQKISGNEEWQLLPYKIVVEEDYLFTTAIDRNNNNNHSIFILKLNLDSYVFNSYFNIDPVTKGMSISYSNGWFMVGQPDYEVVKIYKKENNQWAFTQQIGYPIEEAIEDDGLFGYSIDVSGNYAIIGQFYGSANGTLDHRRAFIFQNINGLWELQETLSCVYIAFGNTVKINSTGTLALVADHRNIFYPFEGHTDYDYGIVFVFKYESGVWALSEKIHAPRYYINEKFGFDFNISGSNIIVGNGNSNAHDKLTPFNQIGKSHIFRSPNTVFSTELKSFQVVMSSGKAHLNWQTNVELQNNQFEIERYVVNSQTPAWEKIATITGNGFSTTPNNYSYLDEQTATGESYYRLKQINLDNSYDYSEILKFQSIPEVVIENISDITDNSATANSKINSLGLTNPTEHGVCWSKTENPTIENNKTTQGAVSETGAFTSSITGLEPNTTYYARAYATNEAGTSYSEQVSFTTTAPQTNGWSEIKPAGVIENWGSTAVNSDGSVIMASSGKLFITKNGGRSWAERRPAGIGYFNWRVSLNSDGTKMIAGYSSGRIYISNNSGTNWIESQPAGDVNKSWRALKISGDGNKIIAGIDGGRIYISNDGGNTWQEVQPAGDFDKNWRIADLSEDGNKIIAGTTNGRIYLTSDGGATWTETQPEGDKDCVWKTVSVSSDGTKLIAGNNDNFYYSSDGGATWQTKPADTWDFCDMSADGNKLIAGGNNYRLFISDNAGDSWNEVQPVGDTDQYWNTLAISGNGSRIIAGTRTVLGQNTSGNLYLNYAVEIISNRPVGGDSQVTCNEDLPRNFVESDFVFSDADDQLFSGIQITQLHSKGMLKYNNSDVELLSICNDVTKLQFWPNADENGNNYTTFKFKVMDNSGVWSENDYTMTINVTPVNDWPLSEDKTFTVPENLAKTFKPEDFTFNDKDGDSFSGIMVHSVGLNTNLKYDGIDVTHNQEISDVTKLTYTPSEVGSQTQFFNFKVYDGTEYSPSTNVIRFNVIAANDKPTGENDIITIIKNDNKTFAMSDFTFSDVNGDTLRAIKIIQTVAKGSLKNDGADVTVNMVCTDITKLVYSPLVDEIGDNYAQFTFKVFDGFEYSDNEYTMTINVVESIVPPVLAELENETLEYIESDDPVQVTENISITYENSNKLTGATVAILNYKNNEDMLGFNATGGISGSFNEENGTLAFTGTATKAKYEQVLNTVTYSNVGATLTEEIREISFTVNDGNQNSNTVSRNINVSGIKIPENAPEDIIFSAVNGNSVTLSFKQSNSARKYLIVRKSGSEPTFVPVDGTEYTAGIQGDDVIVAVSSNNKFTDTNLEAGIDYYYAVYAYNGKSNKCKYLKTPLTGKNKLVAGSSDVESEFDASSNSVSRSFPDAGVSISFPDGTNGTRIKVTKNVKKPQANIGGIPNVKGAKPLYFTIHSTNETPGNYSLVLDFSSLALNDWSTFKVLKRKDSDSPWQDIEEAPINATITNRETDGVAGKFTITGLSSFSDFMGGEAVSASTPTTVGIPNVTVNENAPNSEILLNNYFNDLEDGANGLTYSVDANSNAGLFTLVTVQGNKLILDYAENVLGSANITIRATDTGSDYIETTFNVTVSQAITAPIGSNSSISINKNTTYNFAVNNFSFSDTDGGSFAGIRIETVETAGELKYNGVDVSIGLDCPDITKLTFVPASNSIGSPYASFTYKLKDSQGLYSATAYTLTINVVITNNTPTTIGIPNVTVNEDALPIEILLTNYFNDVEDGAAGLTYVIESNTKPHLFSSSTIENNKLKFSFAPDSSGVSTINIRATDTSNDFVIASFTATINPINDAPIISNLNNDNANILLTAKGNIDTGTIVEIVDIDSPNFDTGNLSIQQLTGAVNGSFAVDGVLVKSGADAEISVSEVITVNDVNIGVVDAVQNGLNGNNLLINFNANATAEKVKSLISNLNYSPSSGVGDREFVLTLNDGDGTANGGVATASANIKISVNKINPTVSEWPTATNIISGENLSKSTLSGGLANVSGTFAFADLTTIPNPGLNNASVIFTPTDVQLYNIVEGKVNVNVRVLIKFESNGGSDVNPIITDCSTKITSLLTPTKIGNSFEGWYKESELTNQWDCENDLVESNITLYAKWSITQYTVTFETNGGSEVNSVKVNYNEKITVPTEPTKANHTFLGWYKESELTNRWDFENDVVKDDLTLYAKWNSLVGVDEHGNLPSVFNIEQNYPNPFNPATTISFALPEESEVYIEVFNLLGARIEILKNSTMSAGYHKLKWNAQQLGTGVYFCRIIARSNYSSSVFTKTIKMNLLK